jgi:hypothetical protein
MYEEFVFESLKETRIVEWFHEVGKSLPVLRKQKSHLFVS